MTDIAATHADAKVSPRVWYSLFLFFLVYTMISIDRSILAIMIEPIKEEFKLNDSQVGFLTGIAFALFFGIAGIPLGRWADKGNRKIILSGSLFVFSFMTAAAGFATSFLQLLSSRLIVGAGEAGGGPAALSMLSDHFPPHRRASAISFYYLGSPISQILMFLFGGMLVAAYGWRSVFWAAGALGIALAALIFLTVREPERRSNAGSAVAEALPLRQVLAFIRSQPSLLHILGCGMITSAVSSGMGVWAASFLIRSHHMDVKQAGAVLALSLGLAGGLGIAISGFAVDWLGRRDIRWRSWFCAVTQLMGLPMFLLFLLAPSPSVALIGLAGWSITQHTIYAPAVSLCQSLVGARMRGAVMAVFYFLANFMGFGMGPQIVGILSDVLQPHVLAESLRYALVGFSVLFVWAAYHYYRAGTTLGRDFDRASEAS